MKKIPIAFVSDSPDASSGLARITRDLATRLSRSQLPFEVATIGFGGYGSKDLNFPQYQCGTFMTAADIPRLVPAWLDFTKGEPGVIFTIYDIHRLEAFRFPEPYGMEWTGFLGQKDSPFYLASYIPIDSHSPKGLTSQSADILKAMDKVVAYGEYGKGILEPLCGRAVPALPHGIDCKVFKPQEKGKGRAFLRKEIPSEVADSGKRILQVSPEDKLLGVVATNQTRKDWGSLFQAFAKLPPEWKLWANTDKLIAYWSLPDLAEQFGVQDRTFITSGLPDVMLAQLYSDADVTVGIGRGEGYGYPLSESMACGTPCIHLNYAGGADLLPQHLLLQPLLLQIETPYCLQRPVWDADELSRKIQAPPESFDCTKWAQERYDWATLWPNRWKPFFGQLAEQFKEWRNK